jgi:putative inorganic carbon (hco3(-)) transporter
VKGLIITYLLCYGGAVAAIFSPFIGVLIYICFAIIRPQMLWYWVQWSGGNFSRVVAIGMVVGWILHRFGSWRMGRAAIAVNAIIAYMAWIVISAMAASNTTVAWEYVDGMFKIILPCIVAFTLIDSLTRVRQLLWTIVLCQGYLALEFNQWYFSGYNRLRLDGFGTLDNNGVAVMLVLGVGLAAFLAIETKNLWGKGVATASLLLMIHAILFSFSRGGMVALCATGIVSFFLIKKRGVHYLLFGLLVLASLRLAGNEVQNRFMTSFVSAQERDSSATGRLRLWSACLDLAVKHPIFGIGPGNFKTMADTLGFGQGRAAHTTFLSIAAELGFPGVILILIFYLSVITRIWPIARSDPDPSMSLYAKMIIASLIGFFVAAQFVEFPLLEQPYYIAITGAAILRIAPLSKKSEEEKPREELALSA